LTRKGENSVKLFMMAIKRRQKRKMKIMMLKIYLPSKNVPPKKNVTPETTAINHCKSRETKIAAFWQTDKRC
jgi:hypothetical protein